MKRSKQIHKTLTLSASFLFENRKISYITQRDKSSFEKESFAIESLSDEDKIFKKLKENSFYDKEYSFIDVSILNDQFTLIPLEYFEEDLAEIFLNYNVPYSPNMGIRFNLVPQFNLALVFYYFESLENIFKESSEKVRITHTGFKFLSKIGNKKHLKDGFFIQINQEYFELAVIEKGALLLYNTYPYKNTDDIIYFLRVISNNLDKELPKMPLYYYGIDKNKEEYIDEFAQYFKEVFPGVGDDFERENYTTLDIL